MTSATCTPVREIRQASPLGISEPCSFRFQKRTGTAPVFFVREGDSMAQEFSRSFYNSRAWQKCREAYKSYSGGLCERCWMNGVVTAGEEVHHIQPLTPTNIGDPNVTLSFDNLMLLCRDCHMAIHSEMADATRAGRKRVSTRYKIDENSGRVIIEDPPSVEKSTV